MVKKLVVFVVLATSCWQALAEGRSGLLTAADLGSFENPPADARIHYGDGPLQFGDLRLPPGNGPHPVAVFIHGGCWLAGYDIAHSSKLTAADLPGDLGPHQYGPLPDGGRQLELGIFEIGHHDNADPAQRRRVDRHDGLALEQRVQISGAQRVPRPGRIEG